MNLDRCICKQIKGHLMPPNQKKVINPLKCFFFPVVQLRFDGDSQRQATCSRHTRRKNQNLELYFLQNWPKNTLSMRDSAKNWRRKNLFHGRATDQSGFDLRSKRRNEINVDNDKRQNIDSTKSDFARVERATMVFLCNAHHGPGPGGRG